MISWVWPWVWVLLPLPWLMRWLLPRAEQRSVGALRIPFFAALKMPGQQNAMAASRWQRLLGWLVWLLLLAASAQPQWLGQPVSLPLTGRDLMLAVDISGSMEQQDYRLNGRLVDRLQMVKAVAGQFIEARPGDRLGLILFGSRAYLQTPLTYDRRTVKAMLNEAVIGLAGRQTAVGDAIVLAVKRLREQPADNRILVLLTDGATTAGSVAPLSAIELAAQAQVRVYTIGIGAGDQQGLPGDASQPRVDLDAKTLQTIAQRTGGRYFEATDTEQLEQVYAELNRLEPSVRDSRSLRPVLALYMWPAALALLISILLVWSTLPVGVQRQAAGGQDVR